MIGKKGKIKKDMHGKSGQALIIILLVMAVSLTLGVSVATRTISTVRQISFSAQSAEALAFAEAGVEEALKDKCPAGGACGLIPKTDPNKVNLDGIAGDDFEYYIEPLISTNLPEIDKDSTIELSLTGHSGSVTVCWSSVLGGTIPALTGNYITQSGVTYNSTRRSFDPDGSANRRPSNNFSNPSPKPAACSAYQYGGVFPAGAGTPLVLRLRPLYAGPVAIAAPNVSASQGSLITSTGFSGQVRRRVEVKRTLPALSELFDYAVFSGSTNQILEKN